METLILVVFFLGYLAITLEHNLKIDKLIPALAMMAILWALISLTHLPVFDIDTVTRSLHETHIEEILLHHLGKTAEILVFLLGAMTIVEIIDYFDGFATIKGFIRTHVSGLQDSLSLLQMLVVPGLPLEMLPPPCCGLAKK